MTGIISCIIAGAAMSVQGVMNTRLSEKIGLWESNAFVQGTAFAASLIIALIFGRGGAGTLRDTNRLYLLGGLVGVVITVTVMLGMGKTSPAVAVSVILIAQLFTAALIDAFGIMGTEKTPFLWNKYIGLALMTGGVLLFKLKP
ncbi:MAG TPA: DMT family transporter [Candidatus Ornithomonoglobus intestinigallinarum]|uniref:DMT family transporter n=1 Tax=Candidatus Ornithomonoglobus intestinigallinarum TaxID=2840894 RepID=A0A9D1H1L7_9FIRM|nr:DMT family transporter [Candidatus Ornithomonoglobus intestinigallinarum]